MQDKLKERFENEKGHDIYEPTLGHRERFAERLKQEMKHKPEGLQLNISFKLMRIAAAAAVLITAISFAWFWDNTKVNPIENTSTLSLADISDRYLEVESFYQEQMSARLTTLRSEDNEKEQITYKEAISKLERLEIEYKKLERDLTNNPGNTRIVFAMIKNYQLRITVLETLLQKLNIKEHQKTEENEKAYLSTVFSMGLHIVTHSA